MITTVYLIRHGKTTGGEEKRYKGHIDVSLSEEGIYQIQQLAQHMIQRLNGNSRESNQGSGRLAGVYSSDLKRAVTSAEIISRPFGIKPETIAQIRERSFGKWEGMTFDEIRASYPDEFEAWANNPLKFSPVGGESTEDVKERLMPVFYEIIQRHRNQNVAIVGHGGVNRVILCELLNIPLEYIFRIEQDFAALNVIEFYDDIPVLKVMNYTTYFLEED